MIIISLRFIIGLLIFIYYLAWQPSIAQTTFDRYLTDSFGLWQINTNQLPVYTQANSTADSNIWEDLKGQYLDIRQSILIIQGQSFNTPEETVINCEGQNFSISKDTLITVYKLSSKRHLFEFGDTFSCEYDAGTYPQQLIVNPTNQFSQWWLKIHHPQQFSQGWIEVSAYIQPVLPVDMNLIYQGRLAQPLPEKVNTLRSGVYTGGLIINSYADKIYGSLEQRYNFDARKGDFLEKCFFYFYSDQQDENGVWLINYWSAEQTQFLEGRLAVSWLKLNPRAMLEFSQQSPSCQVAPQNNQIYIFDLLWPFKNQQLAIVKETAGQLLDNNQNLKSCLMQLKPLLVSPSADGIYQAFVNLPKRDSGLVMGSQLWLEEDIRRLPQIAANLSLGAEPTNC